jgi:hypothetical protein
MKKSKLQLSLGIFRAFSFFLVIAVLTSCISHEGPMGPPGYDGQDGRDGQDGLDGINYTHSILYDVDPADWSGDLDGYNTVLDVPEITEDIYYDGAVLVYRLIETEPKSFNLLPYTYVDNALSIYFDFDAYVGSINLIYKEVFDLVNDTPAPEEVMTFKVVIFEGIPLATLKTMVDVNDYNAVTKMFHVEGGNNQGIQ